MKCNKDDGQIEKKHLNRTEKKQNKMKFKRHKNYPKFQLNSSFFSLTTIVVCISCVLFSLYFFFPIDLVGLSLGIIKKKTAVAILTIRCIWQSKVFEAECCCSWIRRYEAKFGFRNCSVFQVVRALNGMRWYGETSKNDSLEYSKLSISL